MSVVAVAAAKPAAKKSSAGPLPWLKPGVFVGALAPLAAIVCKAATGRLGSDPIATALNQFGLVALIFLVGSLACTPLKTWTGWTWPLRIRKTFGLYGFFYACLHLLTYVGIDQSFNVAAMVKDIGKNPFIMVGLFAFTLLIPLAVTSTSGWVRRLGKNWQRLHKLAYAIGILGVIHFYMRMKSDVTQPIVYGCVIGVLLGTRALAAARKKR